MARSRAWLTDQLTDPDTGELAPLLADLGKTDTADDWLASPLDQALRALGADEDSLSSAEIDNANVMAALSLATYYAIRKGVRALAQRVDTRTEAGLDRKRSQAFDHWSAELKRAETEAQATGYLASADAATFGRLTLDFLEPACEAFG